MHQPLSRLQPTLDGQLYWDEAMRTIYATDASSYRELPLAVAHPKTAEDIRRLIAFASQQHITLIPRAAGTSLAGQVVGNGLVVDVSKYMTRILEINAAQRWVRVQPGVIRDDLNVALRDHGLFFGPETSTANRAMIGGMVGNNSCGLHSVAWGTTRDHLLGVKGFLSDGSPFALGLDAPPPAAGSLAHRIQTGLHAMLSDAENQRLIRDNFPKPSIRRRNTGYALDSLAVSDDPAFWLPLVAGSEGTLVFLTEITLNLLPLPPREVAVVCVHAHSLDEALQANRIAMQRHRPMASELVDRYILDFTKGHPEYDKNRFFIEGDPAAILMVEFMADTAEKVRAQADALLADLQQSGFGYAFPVIYGEPTKQVWDVRKAGLGLIRNLPGDTQPVNLIEDCAVDVADLPDYIRDLETLLQGQGLSYSMYAHAGAGELHVEPMINLKTTAGNALFRQVLADTAALVKKYNGSLSGEHGDGRLRGEFIPFMMGEAVYGLFKQVKALFDPGNIFNAGKITGTPPMDTSLRYTPGQQPPEHKTVFDFSREESMLRLTEKCSGSGDCRKTHLSGGTMCPSYMATRDEKDTTRARANILREWLTQAHPAPGPSPSGKGFFSSPLGGLEESAKEVLDLCLSCKACKSECPSNVDMAKLKAEFYQHYHDRHGLPLRSRLIGQFTRQMRLASLAPGLYNRLAGTPALRRLLNRAVGFHPDRTLPLLGRTTLRRWLAGRRPQAVQQPGGPDPKPVWLFCDEFTDYNDTEMGIKAVRLLERLGYTVRLARHVESGRTYLSKGMVRQAKALATRNVELLAHLVTEEVPLVGLEPSAILTFRDEYPDLVPEPLKAKARQLGRQAMLFEEFFVREIDAGRIDRASFTTEARLIKLHGHCHQKALASVVPTKKMLSLPANYRVELIPSGCCGMAGSFGYEREHYAVSMQVGELVLFPAVRAAAPEVVVAAPGTSCRHQIHDGTGRHALHPAEILYDALV